MEQVTTDQSTVAAEQVSDRESVELRFTDLSSPDMVAGLARRC
ncbi:hypothetical protein [Herbidospora sp. RD11066]